MLLKLTKQARVTLAPGTVIDVSGAQATFLLSTNQAVVVVETAPPKTAQVETAEVTPTPAETEATAIPYAPSETVFMARPVRKRSK